MKKNSMKFLIASMMVAASVLFGVRISNINVKPDVPKPSSNMPVTKKLILKVDGDFVSLFSGEDVIETFSEVDLMTLPQQDRDMLLDGIEISSIEEAYRLIEDFDG